MDNSNTIQKEIRGKIHNQGVGLDPLVVISLLIKNWYIFVIAVFVALMGARVYISHTLPIYRVSTTILINDTGERSMMNNDDLLQGLGLPGGMRNMENQMYILSSREVTERALSDLPFEIEFYFKTARNKMSIYPDSPIKLLSDGEIPLPRDTEFSLEYLGNNMFHIESESDRFPFSQNASFGEVIELNGGSFHIECWNEDWFKINDGKDLNFLIHSRRHLISYFNNRINVNLLSRGGSILEVSMVGTNAARDVDFLNKLSEVFIAISLDKKNVEATRRILFIDDQLIGISDSLALTENKLQKFRSANRIMDISSQGQAIIAQVTLLENERARLKLEANYYDYLADYLAKEVSTEIPIVPITMGISDPGLTRLVTELAELQEQLLSRRVGEMNPLQNLLDQRVRSTKAALLETLNGLRRANSLARHENEVQINKVNTQASALPVTERQLLGIERKFRINDELYTFLLETRAEQQMQKASNVADSEVINIADSQFRYRVAPNPTKIYFVGMFAGFGIPFIIIFLNFLFNKKLKEEDIRKMTDIPIAGTIPKSQDKKNTVVFENPNSTIAEAYRLLRSKMQFFTKETSSPVILVTSSMPGEGKTFTAINLASVYSLLGKKTILVGYDLRKPGIYNDFLLENNKGVSTWLIGQDKLEDIIQKTSYENLSVILAGPVPPNPSELTSLEKTNDLLNLLKERYEFIIIDSSPIGLVSDTFHLASLADSCLLVVRSGKTLRDMLSLTLREIDSSNIKGISLVINDAKSDATQYIYGDKFGYTNDKASGNKIFGGKKKVKKDAKLK
ncbi:MAG: polysaccharide biosynthesis tyrosine autokinase [Bacteroidales bacterium]|nr:polysaccharide biosynthesis tyrosine autokinase [Bacteroidales bacterium]MCF8390281.1 polysaccharide biosynthesis tyrosine autokinase [Bacteroidales bacterium]